MVDAEFPTVSRHIIPPTGLDDNPASMGTGILPSRDDGLDHIAGLNAVDPLDTLGAGAWEAIPIDSTHLP
jgi:hypothetical protein